MVPAIDRFARRLLLVDDDETLCQLLTTALGDWGYQVTSAQTVTQARSFIATEAFDGAILDLIVGDVRGQYLLDLLDVTDLPVLIVSGACPSLLPPELRSRLFLRKPYRLSELRVALAALMPAPPIRDQAC